MKIEILETLNEWRAFLEGENETIPAPLVEGETRIGFLDRGFVSGRFICEFDTEKVRFDVSVLMTDKEGEENAAALVKLAIISLKSSLNEKVEVIVDDDIADYNGGTIEDFLLLLDKAGIEEVSNLRIIYP